MDPTVTHKCLEMIVELMQDPAIKNLNPTMMTLIEDLIMPSIRDLEPEVRKVAVKALGVCCIRSIELARQNLLLLFQVR